MQDTFTGGGTTYIVEALKNFQAEMIKSKAFYTENFKSFMEPIFESAGYRDKKFTLENISEARNILIIHDAGVGDFVNCSAAIRNLRRIFPNAHITLVNYSRARALTVACPYADSVFTNDRRCIWTSFFSLFEWDMNFVKNLLPFKFDFAFCFCAWLSGYFLAYMAGSKNIVGFDKNSLANNSVFPYDYIRPIINWQVPRDSNAVHSVDNYLSLVEGFLKQPIKDRDVEIWTTARDFFIAENILSEHDFLNKKIFCICMGGEAVKKHYPPEKYATVIQKISELDPESRFVIIGGSADVESGKIFSERFSNSERVLDLTNKVDYRVSAAILSKAYIYIGNDTGTSHIAAAMRCPCLSPAFQTISDGLNSKTLPRIYYPYRVPSVIIIPLESSENSIASIEVSKMLQGFHLLREKIRIDDRSVTYLC